MSVDSFVKRNCKSANDDERCLRIDHLNALKLFQLFIAQKWRLSRKIDIVRKKRRELSNARVWYESRDEKINVWDRENKWVWARHWDVRRSESTRALAKKEFEISHSFVLLYRRNSDNCSMSFNSKKCQVLESSRKIQNLQRMRKLDSWYHFWIIICFSSYIFVDASLKGAYCMYKMCSFLSSTKCTLQIFHIINFDS